MPSSDSIQYYNRYSRQVETEQVYGLAFLKWTYGNPLGKLSLHGFVKKAFFSKWYGRRMDDGQSREKIAPFIQTYRLNPDEFADDAASFRTFNEFFYRKLKPGSRPIASGKASAVFPADGRHLGFPDLSKVGGIFVKGQKLDLNQMLGDAKLARRYQEGTFVLSRLCPVDYHRFHFPVSGLASQPRVINGPLYSVNPIALRKNIWILAENKRAVCTIDSPEFGKVLMLEIGATCVGSFEYTFQPGERIEKGAEKGFFKFGGSSTITLFEPGTIQLDDDLVEYSQKGMELYARMGDHLGDKNSRS